MNITADMLKLAHKASLKIIADDKGLTIRHKLRWSDKFLWGLIIMVFGGCYILYILFSGAHEMAPGLFALALGGFFAFGGALAIIAQAIDNVKLTENEFSFRRRLVRSSVPIEEILGIEVRSEVHKIRFSRFIVTTLVLRKYDDEIPILLCQMDVFEAHKAGKLGTTLMQLLDAQLRKIRLNYKN